MIDKTEVIVFQEAGRTVSIMWPATAELTVLEIGQKDVPHGQPFWIVPASDLPEDRSFRDAWELDVDAMGEPSGVGGTYQPRAEEEDEQA